MNCLFCEATESCYVELVCWDESKQRARELLLRGVCAMHAAEMPVHPKDPEMCEMHPAFHDRKYKLAVMHRATFPMPPGATAAPTLRYGQRYFAYDSIEGAMVRQARDKERATHLAQVNDGAAGIEIERVPDVAALAEVMRDAAAKGSE